MAERKARKGFFYQLAIFSFVILLGIWEVLWWLVEPRVAHLNNALHIVVTLVVQGIAILFVLSLAFLLLTVKFPQFKLFSRYSRRFFMHTYPLAYRFGRWLGLRKEQLGETFILINNVLVKRQSLHFLPGKMMILLPHCLQQVDCNKRITTTLDHCVECGACDISSLKQYAGRNGIGIFVATGGTLARRIIVDHRPEFIVAVACHRDLVAGIREAYPIPVYGILNQRPQGPCINTKVALKEIQKAMEFFR